MKAADYLVFLVLAVFNLAVGAGLAFPLAKNLQQIRGVGSTGSPSLENKLFRYFLIFVGIYFAECVAFPMGMCTQIFTVFPSFVWGLVFGLWLRKYSQAGRPCTALVQGRIIRLAVLVAVYGSLPTASFCVLITILKVIGGGNILSGAEGAAFGIPGFLPWPFNSILGFSAGVLAGTVILKIFVTYITTNYVARHSKIKAD